jgi:hypothetical protein
MSTYVPPANNAVNFAIEVFTPADLTPAGQALTAYTPPGLSAVDFALTAYTKPTYPYVGWELLPGAGSVTGTLAWTEDNDVFAVAATVSQNAALAWTEANDATAAAATVSQSATLAWVEADDVTAIQATVSGSSSATLAWTEEDDLTAIQGNVEPELLIIDGHDGKKLKKQFRKEKERNKRRKDKILEAYEIIFEGRPAVAEKIAKPFTTPATKASPVPTIDFDALLSDLDAVQTIMREMQEMDDEEALTLLW